MLSHLILEISEELIRELAGPTQFLRGQAFVRDGKVDPSAKYFDRATFWVKDGNTYHVTLSVQGDYLTSNCTCVFAKGGTVCKHQVAALLFSKADLQHKVQEAPWELLGELLLDDGESTTPARTQKAYCLFFSLQRQADGDYSIRPVVLNADVFLGAFANHPLENREIVKDFLFHNPRIADKARWANRLLTPEKCVNARPEAVAFANLLIRLDKGFIPYYLRDQNANNLGENLDVLSRFAVDVFLGEGQEPIQTQLAFEPDHAEIQYYIKKSAEGIAGETRLMVGGKSLPVSMVDIQILNENPPWFLMGSRLVRYKDGPHFEKAGMFLGMPRLQVPPAREKDFVERFLLPVARRMRIIGDELNWEEIETTPVKRLYIFEEDNLLKASLNFAYDDLEVPYLADDAAEAIQYKQNGQWTLVKIKRAVNLENLTYTQISSTRYGLKKAPNQPGVFDLRANVDPVDFLLRKLPMLVKDGFEIYGEEKLKSVRVNRSQPTVRMSISSGIDWFDLGIEVIFGDVSATMQEVRRSLRKKTSFVKLSDGSIGELPQEWIQKYQRFFNLGTTEDNKIRFSQQQIGLLDHLLENEPVVERDEAFQEKLDVVRSARARFVRPVPEGFSGELRPYQKVGFDWMWFLRDNQLGGCLADDMGLGKTIQVLAFLQSLKESSAVGESARPLTHLVVVPRSLLVNWQREIDRFAPGIRFHVHFGGTRSKKPLNFTDYDIVLTTYGTMLRDIQMLRSFLFEYVILDESQAIKNPNAQVSKSARLLRSNYKLVMTGTPVENSTYELWAQFAFLNPGMFGSLAQFQREFVLPIEKKKDLEAMELLRSIIQPVLLRRTKELVAPELPERTERIVYCDLDTGQRKLYTQTRDQYRKTLLGIIAQEGVERSRMHVLEGLLRLRQICDHPLLVDSQHTQRSAKIEFLIETLQTLQAEGHKALVFSQFVQMLQLIRAELDREKIPYAYLDGQTYNRAAQIDLFQTNPTVTTFLISLKAGGVGLNLTAADYVIHVDPWWNPAVEMQATDRTHRIGQDKPVFVYKLIARDTVEEKILLLQEKKMNLVKQVVTSEDSWFKSLTAEDVEMLFS